MSAVTVTRFVHLDVGHRVHRHEGACSNLHGHRYRVTVTVVGPQQQTGAATGMVWDFSEVKRMLNVVHEAWDHRFLVAEDDPLRAHLSGMPGVVTVPRTPTAENLAELAVVMMTPLLPAGCSIVALSMQETEHCEATWTA